MSDEMFKDFMVETEDRGDRVLVKATYTPNPAYWAGLKADFERMLTGDVVVMRREDKE